MTTYLWDKMFFFYLIEWPLNPNLRPSRYLSITTRLPGHNLEFLINGLTVVILRYLQLLPDQVEHRQQ